ncbi:hypothetical protein GW17_00024769 [Ensete ventricosum]|nr:hypothetical protein GW17_00024769 [Ensete ventricosum]
MGQDQRRDPGSRNRSGALSESVAGGKAAEGEGGDVDVAVDRCFVRGGGYDSTKVSFEIGYILRAISLYLGFREFPSSSLRTQYCGGLLPAVACLRWPLLLNPKWRDLKKKREKRRTKSPSRSQTPLPLVMAEEEQKEEKPFPPVITLKVLFFPLARSFSFLILLVFLFVLFFFFVLVASVKVISLLWGDLTGSVEKWVALVRKRSGGFPPSGFPHRHPKGETMPDACPMTNRQRRYRLIVR